VIPKESYRKLRKSSTFAIRQAATQLSPGGGTTFQTFPPLSFGKSFMKIRSAVPEKGCLIVLTDGKKCKKNICKTYTHPPPTGRRLRKKAAALLKQTIDRSIVTAAVKKNNC